MGILLFCWIYRKLAEAPYKDSVDWSKWHVFWVDERVVKRDHVDSNYKLALDGFLSKVNYISCTVRTLSRIFMLSSESLCKNTSSCYLPCKSREFYFDTALVVFLLVKFGNFWSCFCVYGLDRNYGFNNEEKQWHWQHNFVFLLMYFCRLYFEA